MCYISLPAREQSSEAGTGRAGQAPQMTRQQHHTTASDRAADAPWAIRPVLHIEDAVTPLAFTWVTPSLL